MSVQTAPARRTHTETSDYRLNFGHALRSEWIKLATVRSTWWSIAITAVLTVGIGTLIAASVPGDSGFPGIQAVVSPIQFTMLLAGILGAIAVTGEYSTGMIRSTLTANPIRGGVLAAKATVLAVFMFVASLVIFAVTAAIVTPILAGKDLGIDWGDFKGSIVPVLVASVTMAVFALIGVAFGFIIRNGAGAIAATVGLLFVLPVVVSMFGMAGDGWRWILDLANYLPSAAAQNVILPQDDWGLTWQVASVTLAGWVVAGMLGAWAVLRNRDA
ncbi:ABC transporter permease subunit [Microbacterium sp. NPDC057650]|uniref:ABC transporter permease subunit n=1 Tax=unclassified Microbacterium TaxID=2609290 RepID=UPI003671DF06